METVTAGLPNCYLLGGYGTNTAAFSTTAAAHAGTVAEQLVMSNYSNGDAKILPSLDLGTCAPTTVPGHTYSLREWYTSTAVTQFAVYTRNSAGTWQYWTSSPWFAPSSTYVQAVWTTPALPTGTTGLSFGLNLFQNGTLTTDDLSMYDTVGAPALISTIPSAAARALDQTARSRSGQLATRVPLRDVRQVRGVQKKGAVQVFDWPAPAGARG